MNEQQPTAKAAPEEEEMFLSYGEISDALQKETDRAAAILAASFLEARLEQALRTAMVEGVDVDRLFRSYAPLSTFSGKIDVAHAFGITSVRSNRDLGLVRKVRNYFAHHAKVTSFGDSPVRDWCSELYGPEVVITDDPELAHIDFSKPRTRFLFSIVRLMVVLWTNSKIATSAKFPRL